VVAVDRAVVAVAGVAAVGVREATGK